MSIPRYYIDQYCDLASFEPGRPIILAHDGSECTLIEVDGIRTIQSGEDIGNDVAAFLGGPISNAMKKHGHKLTVSVEVADNVEQDVKPLFGRLRKAAKQKNLDTEVLTAEAEQITMENAIRLKVLIAVWTLPGAAYLPELKEARARVKEGRQAQEYSAINVQEADLLLGPIDSEHRAFVNAVVGGLRTAGIQCRVLGPQEADVRMRDDLREIRQGLLFHETPSDWRPQEAGLRTYPGAKASYNADVSEFFTPRVSKQILSTAAQYRAKSRAVDLGGRTFAMVLMDLFPREPEPFSALYHMMTEGNTRTPFRITFQFDGGKYSPGVMQIIAGFASIASSESKNLFRANRLIQAASRRNDGPVYLKTRILACTWREPWENAEVLEQRRSLLYRVFSAWGEGQVKDIPANPMRALAETVPGMTVGARSGAATFVPVGDAFRMLPLEFYAPIFDDGESVFLTLDHRIAPYKSFSQKMLHWMTIIFATPGSGKSVMMNRLMVEFVTGTAKPGLPFVLAIDLGISSSGTIKLIQEALPPSLRHLAQYIRPSNTRDYAVNFLDTGLGRRKPLAREFDAALRFAMKLVDPPAEHRKEVEILLSAVLRRMYQLKSDMETSSEPATWEPGLDDNVDAACERHGIMLVARKTRWWSIVDRLIQAGDEVNAIRAQRFASPRLKDSGTILASYENSTGVKEYSDEVLRITRTAISAALEEYPIFVNPTKFDLGVARIAAIDLQDVAIIGETDAAKRNNALMFLMARNVFMQKISGHDDEIKDMEFPAAMRPVYESYWRRRHADMAEADKRMQMDEVHVTGGADEIMETVEADARLGRKWGLEIVLASQFLRDFRRLKSMASCVMILKAETKEIRNECRDVFGFNDAVMETLTAYVHGPDKTGNSGANILVRFTLEESERWTVFNNRIGPTMLWALNTTRQDRLVRDEVYRRMSVGEALKLLARRYPSGTALPHFNRVASSIKVEDGDDVSAVAVHVVDEIMREMMTTTVK